MRTKMWSVLVLAALSLPGVAAAGMRDYVPVWISGGAAGGTIGSARNSADTVEYIGCQVSSNWGGTPWAACYAKNSSGSYLTCSSSAPGLVDVAKNIYADAYIYFYRNSDGSCGNLFIDNCSSYEPRRH